MLPLNRLRTRSSKTAQQLRTRLGVHQLEARDVPAGLAQMGGAGAEALGAQAMDAAGNVYLAGTFDQAADFDPGPGTTPWMVPQGSGSDEYLAKYTPDGALVWAKRFGGSGGDAPVKGLTVDGSGNVFVTGSFTGTADFGGVSLAATNSNGNAYVLKLDAATGATAWVRGAGGTGSSYAWGVAVDGDSVYCTGGFSGTADFDRSASYADNHDVLKSAGAGKTPPSDALVWRLRTDGSFVSAWGIGGTGSDSARGLAVAGGSILVEGVFSGTADFDPGPATVSRTSVNGYADMFLTRYTPNTTGGLTLNWVQTVGGSQAMSASAKIVADTTSVYVPGSYSGTIDFDRNNGTSTARDTLTSQGGSQDVFVARYDLASGSLTWVRGIGGSSYNDSAGSAVVLTDTGMVCIGGVFGGTVDFDPARAYADNRDVLTSQGSADGFALLLDSAGAYVNAWRAGGAGYDTSRPVGVYGGRLYATGSFNQTADFPTGGSLTSRGGSDVYLMALDYAPSAPQIGSLTASPSAVPVGGTVTLTAAGITDGNPNSTIRRVEFYYFDATGTKVTLGTATQGSGGAWSITVAAPLAPGTYTLYARAEDSYGVWGDPAALALTVT